MKMLPLFVTEVPDLLTTLVSDGKVFAVLVAARWKYSPRRHTPFVLPLTYTTEPSVAKPKWSTTLTFVHEGYWFKLLAR